VKCLFPQAVESSFFWLDGSLGRRLSCDWKGRALYRIELGEQTFFLSRSGSESLLRHLRMLLFGRMPCCGALREVQMLQQMKSAGFAVMESVAWGQQRIRGGLVRGFLLVRE
jgi:hypothetical protein